jgi:uncharacterized protein DUF4413
MFEQILKFFKPFKEVTTIMSGSTYPTLSTTVPLYNILIDHIEDTVDLENADQIIIAAAATCKEKLEEYYNKTNKTCLIATILDPRFKIQYYEDSNWDELVSEIREK